MKKLIGILFGTLFVSVFLFSISGYITEAQVAEVRATNPIPPVQDPPVIRAPVQVQQPAPECRDRDKGSCQAVCNTVKNAEGSPDPVGCVTAFNSVVASGILCRAEQVTVLVGCDMPSEQACINSQGQKGVWCSCYYLCQDVQVK